jgi:hypothetical protein
MKNKITLFAFEIYKNEWEKERILSSRELGDTVIKLSRIKTMIIKFKEKSIFISFANVAKKKREAKIKTGKKTNWI